MPNIPNMIVNVEVNVKKYPKYDVCSKYDSKCCGKCPKYYNKYCGKCPKYALLFLKYAKYESKCCGNLLHHLFVPIW